MALASPCCALPTLSGVQAILAYYQPRASLVETEGTLYNGSVDDGEGTGLLIGESLVVTDSHVVPPSNRYEKLTMTVRVGSRDAEAVPVQLVARDPDADLAVLKLQKPVILPAPPCPVEVHAAPASEQQGNAVYMLHYGAGQDVLYAQGILSSLHGRDGRWVTDTTMTFGSSGGPIFGATGYLVGFAESGIVWWGTRDTGGPVSGINFIVPANLLVAGPLLSALTAAPSCWSVADATAASAPVMAAAASPAPAAGVATAAATPAAAGGLPTPAFAHSHAPVPAHAAGAAGVTHWLGTLAGALGASPAMAAVLGLPPTPPASAPTLPIPPAHLEREQALIVAAQKKSDSGHSGPSATIFTAERGYRFASCVVSHLRGAMADGSNCTISQDGSQATVNVSTPLIAKGGGAPWVGTVLLGQDRVFR